MTDIVVVGSCVQDLVSYTPRFPKPGESVRGHRFQTGFGGKGANQAITARRLGADVAMVAKVGSDVFGPPTVQNFKTHGINTDFVYVTDEANTATATITVSDSGENSIVVVLGANMLLSENDFHKASDLVAKSKVLCCQLEIDPAVSLAALKFAKSCGGLDPDLFRFADIVCPNENEAEILTGVQVSTLADAKIAANKILDLGADVVILTLGEKGSMILTETDRLNPVHIPCPVVKAIDTTGAGDAFVGALAFYLARMPDLPLQEKVRRSSHIASYSVQHPGTQASYATRDQLDQDLFL